MDDAITRILASALAMAKDPEAAKAKAAKARACVEERQRQTLQVLEKAI